MRLFEVVPTYFPSDTARRKKWAEWLILVILALLTVLLAMRVTGVAFSTVSDMLKHFGV